MRKAIISILASVLYPAIASATTTPAQTLTINVTPPDSYSEQDSIYIVGDFNEWSFDGDKATVLKPKGKSLSIEIPVTSKNTFFTFVKNKDWKLMPANQKAKSECTYVHTQKGKHDELNIRIALWKGDAALEKASHTLAGNIQKHENFAMPQLSRKGHIYVYLPKSYQKDSGKFYPVLYMLDGQNVFDEYTSYGDEWRVDEYLQGLTDKEKDIIVVAIPNSDDRWAEYNPWDAKGQNGAEIKGKGRLTISFVKDTLKPFIDKTYRVKSSAEFTGLAGSSLGGLMSLYAALDHSDTFGFVAAFSPALSIDNMHGNNVLFEAIQRHKPRGKTKIYFDMGLMEYGSYDKVEKLNNLLLGQGLNAENIKFVKDDMGRHCEVDWSKRFPDALNWLI